MRYFVLACDYDGTLASAGVVDDATIAALERVLASGRKLVLVTGRRLDDLAATFDHADLFDWIVAENGAVLFRPSTRETRLLADPPAPAFAALLREKGVPEVATGHVVVATWRPYETVALTAIQELGLDLQVIFNKDAVMVLPAGVTKATGLRAALDEMGLSPHNVVAVGDAENDHAFLRASECGAAVANALPMLKDTADVVLAGDHGAGVRELVDELVTADLAARDARLVRHHVPLGRDAEGGAVVISPQRRSLLVAGPSGGGKSTVVAGLLERLMERVYQCCIVDPEGDYADFPGAVTLGTAGREPDPDEVLTVLATAASHVVVSLVGMAIPERPPFFLSLLPRLLELRVRTGRPHWLAIDEAHHLWPTAWEPGGLALPMTFSGLLLVTVHPDEVSPVVLGLVDTAIAVGRRPAETIEAFAGVVGTAVPRLPPLPEERSVVVWSIEGPPPAVVVPEPPRAARRRHVRKYAEGELPLDRCFVFRGADGKLTLRARNLIAFLALGEGLDDETWLHHLDAGDYSRWFREGIKDEELAAEAERVEGRDLGADESRRAMRRLVEERYTVSARPGMPMPGTAADASRVDAAAAAASTKPS